VRPPPLQQLTLLRGVRPGPDPGSHKATRGPVRPQLKLKDLVRLAESGPSRNRFTTSVRSFTRQRPGILKRISFFMPFSLRPGNSAITFRPTRLWW
jgi:hypothetical protein